MSRYQRWGGTDKHGCTYKGLYMQTEKQMGRQVCLSVLAEKSTCLHGQDFLERKIKTKKDRKKLKHQFFILIWITVTDISEALINDVTMWWTCLRTWGEGHYTIWCTTENPLPSPLTGLNWVLKLFFLMLCYHGRACGAYLLGSPSASSSFPMSCSYDVPTVALLLPAATVRWYSQVF